jgi:ubiquinone/menaquinone biosynthesis C-methylase UbiE
MNLKLPFHIPYLKIFQMAHMAASKATTYTRMTGGCTVLIASQMLTSLTPPITPSSYILDSACGPGIVSAEIKALYPDAKIMATDLSPAMIAEVQARITSEAWKDVNTEVLDARGLSSLGGGMFTHVFMNLGLPARGEREESVRGVREVVKGLKVGGVALFSVWAGRSHYSLIVCEN